MNLFNFNYNEFYRIYWGKKCKKMREKLRKEIMSKWSLIIRQDKDQNLIGKVKHGYFCVGTGLARRKTIFNMNTVKIKVRTNTYKLSIYIFLLIYFQLGHTWPLKEHSKPKYAVLPLSCMQTLQYLLFSGES